MSRRVASVAALLLVGLASGCGSTPSDEPSLPIGTIADAEGSWGASTTMGQAYLNLEDGGSATGSDGCNTVTAEWSSTGEGVSFSSWTTTDVYCPEVDPWLATSVAALVQDDDTMVFLDQYNVQVGTLQRTD
jgi:heat shock protein HslJ